MGFMDMFAKVPSVDAATARDLVRDGAVLLDVRESSEWNAGHAPQAAHLPVGRIAEASKKVKVRQAGRRGLSQREPVPLGDQGLDLDGI